VTLEELRNLKTATITREQAASILNVDPRLVSKGISSGVIPSIKIDRKALVLREPLVRLLTGDQGGGALV